MRVSSLVTCKFGHHILLCGPNITLTPYLLVKGLRLRKKEVNAFNISLQQIWKEVVQGVS